MASALMPAHPVAAIPGGHPPGIVSPTAAARVAATLDRMSAGRCSSTSSPAAIPPRRKATGSSSRTTSATQVTDEFLEIWTPGSRRRDIDFIGQHLRVKGAKVLYPPVQTALPSALLRWVVAAAHELAARRMNVYLTWGEPPDAVAQKLADIRERAARHGRALRFGLRVHVIVRETAKEAWQAAEILIELPRRQRRRGRPVGVRALRLRGPAANVSLARRAPRQAGGQPEPVGRRGPGPGRRRNRAGRRSPRPWPPASANMPTWGSRPSSFPAIPTSKRPTGSRSCCSLCWRTKASSLDRLAQTNLTGPFGEMLANDILPKASQS